MKDSIPTLIAMSISGLIFMTISMKFKWSNKVWHLLNKKIKPRYNISLWILFSPIFNISLQLIYEMMGLPYHEIMNGITLGFYMGFMPTLGKGKQD